ncbi:redoxin domain-containing protein [Ruminococcaceae bacterium OttesenSCG-928-A16]|nr:redoxin domain-containing protein [Ruminococcaceae bacterium OttesenSCG-928-A16]
MKKQITFLIAALLFVGLLLGAVFLYNRLENTVQPNATPPASSSAQGQKTSAPDFTVQDAEGNQVLFSSLLGKPVVLNFWASWCPPCKEEMPYFNTVHQEMGDKVTFIMVNLVGGRETLDSGKAFIEETGYTFPVYFDTSGEAATVYGISSIPATFFIDAEGNLVSFARSKISEDTLRQEIQKAIDAS